MKQEISAGGVVIHSTPHIEVLLLQDMNNNWTFPKGLIEVGEDPMMAAQREIAEEVGITMLQLIKQLSSIEYWYMRNNEKIHKKVYYFLFESPGTEKLIPQTEEGIHDVQWFSLEEAKKIVGYKKTNLSLLQSVSS